MFPLSTRFLIVDDMTTMLLIFKKKLKDLGFENVETVQNGTKAMDFLKEDLAAHPDAPIEVVISDWVMPELDGTQLLKAVRGEPAFQHLPFMLVTAEEQKAYEKSYENLDCDGYLQKPITTEKLRDFLKATYSVVQKKQRPRSAAAKAA